MEQLNSFENFDLFNQPPIIQEGPEFDGSDYVPELDKPRLTGQLKAIFDYAKDGKWRTLGELSEWLNYPEASISAQLRNLRKARFGAYTVNKRRRGEETTGLFEYQLIVDEVPKVENSELDNQ